MAAGWRFCRSRESGLLGRRTGPATIYPQLPLGLQIPLLANVNRHESPIGIRVPQAGVLHLPNAEHPSYDDASGHLRNTLQANEPLGKSPARSGRALISKDSPLATVVFSTIPCDLELYGKPMARNVQIWNENAELLLDGPHATPEKIKQAMRTIQAGGVFGYRFLFPAMRVGKHEVYWHRPLVAYRDALGEAACCRTRRSGYLTAYDADKPRWTARSNCGRACSGDRTTGGTGGRRLYPQAPGAAASSKRPETDTRLRAVRGQAAADQLRPTHHGTRPVKAPASAGYRSCQQGGEPDPRDRSSRDRPNRFPRSAAKYRNR